MFALSHKKLDIDSIEQTVISPKCGAVLVFVGRTRDNFEGKQVLRLSYEAYPEMAVKEMKKIGKEIIEKMPKAKVSIVHRLGDVDIGEASVVIAVSTPHRDSCYQASRYAIEELKKRVPIWKKEIYQESAVWKANQ